MHKDGIQGAEGTEGTECLEVIEGRDRALNIRKSIRRSRWSSRNNGEYSREDSKTPKVSRESRESLKQNATDLLREGVESMFDMFRQNRTNVRIGRSFQSNVKMLRQKQCRRRHRYRCNCEGSRQTGQRRQQQVALNNLDITEIHCKQKTTSTLVAITRFQSIRQSPGSRAS